MTGEDDSQCIQQRIRTLQCLYRSLRSISLGGPRVVFYETYVRDKSRAEHGDKSCWLLSRSHDEVNCMQLTSGDVSVGDSIRCVDSDFRFVGDIRIRRICWEVSGNFDTASCVMSFSRTARPPNSGNVRLNSCVDHGTHATRWAGKVYERSVAEPCFRPKPKTLPGEEPLHSPSERREERSNFGFFCESLGPGTRTTR